MICRPVEYLRNGGTLDSLSADYGIKATRGVVFPNLVSLKYDQIASPPADPIVTQCRGIILDEADSWNVVAWPFDRFFNAGDVKAATIDWSKARVQEKLDGSLMILYFYRGMWHVGSSGTPDASGQWGSSPETFSELFWSVWGKLQYPLPLYKDLTYLFELCTPYNRIVVKQPTSRIILTGVRDPATGNEHAVHHYAGLGYEVVQHFSGKGLESFQQIEDSFPGTNPTEREGYVVVDAQFHRVKVKHPGYVALHHMRGNGYPSHKHILQLILAGEYDEVVLAFPEWVDDFAKVRGALEALIIETECVWKAMQAQNFASQKEFALCLLGLKFRAQGVVFSLRKGEIATAREGVAKIHLDKLLEMLKLDNTPLRIAPYDIVAEVHDGKSSTNPSN